MSQDMTFCASECNDTECFRHSSHVKDPQRPHSYAYFKGTEECERIIEQKANTPTITERGWAGHFIASHSCMFRRNTLIEFKGKKWIVSTVGNCINPLDKTIMEIGYHRWYETMVFESQYDVYDDADVSKQIQVNSDWGLWADTFEELEKRHKQPDLAANEMHERIVQEMCFKIQKEV